MLYRWWPAFALRLQLCGSPGAPLYFGILSPFLLARALVLKRAATTLEIRLLFGQILAKGTSRLFVGKFYLRTRVILGLWGFSVLS